MTERLLARRAPAGSVRRERRILFDGVRAEIHPYDVTVERDGAAEAYDCKWGARGINADVLNQLDDARTHAADEDERLSVALVVFDAARLVRCPPGPPDRTAPPGSASSRSRRSTSWRPVGDRRRGTSARSRSGSGSTRPARTACVRTSTLLRYAQDLACVHSAERGFDRAWYAERGLTWLARAAAVAVLAPIIHGSTLTGSTRVVGERRVWARRRTDFRDPAGALVAWTHVDWVLLDARGAPTRIPPEFEGAFGTPKATFPLGRVDPRRRRRRTRGRCAFRVRPQELDPMDHANNAVYADWLDEAVIVAGDAAAVRAVPRLVRLEYARSAEPFADSPARRGRPTAAGRTGWPMPAAAELLRAHLSTTTRRSPTGRRSARLGRKYRGPTGRASAHRAGSGWCVLEPDPR